MQGYDVEFVLWFLEILGYGVNNEGIGYAVEAVFSEFVLGRDGLVDGVCTYVFGDCGVEGGVEVGNVYCSGQDRGSGLDDGESWSIVSAKVLDGEERSVTVIARWCGRLN